MIAIKDLITEYRKAEGIFRFFDKEDPEKTKHTMKWSCSISFLHILLKESYTELLVNITTMKIKMTRADIKQLIAIAAFHDKI